MPTAPEATRQPSIESAPILSQPIAPVAIPLDRLPLGRSGRIVRLDGDSQRLGLLREMGLWENARVASVRRAPLGDPLQVRVFGCHLALRRKDAQAIWVTPLPEEV